MYKGTYVSNKEQQRDEARELGYENVVTHPNDIGVPEVGDILVIDFNHILREFDDWIEAVQKAVEHARRGVLVGIHTYHPEDPRLDTAHAEPHIKVAKTHQKVLALLLDCSRSVSTSLQASVAAKEEDLAFWLEAAQAEIDSQVAAEPTRLTQLQEQK